MIYQFERTIRTSNIIRTTSTLPFLASFYHSNTAITSMHPNYHDHECSYVYLLQLDLFQTLSLSVLLSPSTYLYP